VLTVNVAVALQREPDGRAMARALTANVALQRALEGRAVRDVSAAIVAIADPLDAMAGEDRLPDATAGSPIEGVRSMTTGELGTMPTGVTEVATTEAPLAVTIAAAAQILATRAASRTREALLCGMAAGHVAVKLTIPEAQPQPSPIARGRSTMR